MSRDSPEYSHIVKIFPKRLKEMMGDMTFAQLSLLSGVSPSALTSWSQGRVAPGITSLVAVCNVLDASIDWIIGLDEIANAAAHNGVSDTQDNVSDTQDRVYYIQLIEDDET